MTLKDAIATARALGFSLSKRDREYRLAPRDASGSPAERELQAYYTNDLEDAIATARHWNKGLDNAKS